MYVFSYFLMTLLMFSGLFLIGLILLQRGRGGGLAGAFGGMGGQSAFGTKAGDVFTRITIGVATAWILLCASSVVTLRNATAGRTDSSIFKAEGAADELKKAAPKGEEPEWGDAAPPKAAAGAAAVAPDKDPAKKDAADGEKPAEEKKPEEPAADKPAEPKPDEAKPVEPKPAEPNAEEVKPAEPAKPEPEKKPDEPKPEAAPEKKPE